MGTKKNKYEQYFRDNLSSEEITQVDKICENFASDTTQELEISFKNINYPNYVRIMRYYADVTDEKDISGETSLDIVLVLAGGNNMRVTLIGDEKISNFIGTYSNSTRDHIINNLLKIKPSDDTRIMLKNRG